MFGGIKREKDPFYENLYDSVEKELSKYAEPVVRDNNGVQEVSVEQAYQELLQMQKKKEKL